MSSDATVYFTTLVGAVNESDGRASHFFRSEDSVVTCLVAQNKRAEDLGIKARYVLAECDAKGIEGKNIRD